MTALTRLIAMTLGASIVASAQAQGTPAPAAADTSMADYLGLLEQIAPAAREGAEAYLRAHRVSCSRALTTAELRRAFSHGDGDPVLMAMIRASRLRDAKATAGLARILSCGARK